MSFKIGYAYTQREVCVSKSIGLAYSWKEIYVSNLQKDFTETLLEYVDLSKTRQCKYFVYMNRENPNQTEQGTMQTEINCDTLTAIIWRIQKLCYCTVIALFSLYLRAISKYKPPGAYTASSRKVVWKNVDATIPNGNMRYDQHTVPDTVAVEPSFVSFF